MSFRSDPLVLVGESTSHRIVDACRRLGWGRMWVYRNIRPIDGEKWGFDNGVFKLWDRKGPMTHDQFDADGYMRRLEKAQKVGTPYLAVVPDLIAAGNASIDFSMIWRELMPKDWPLYLAVQDGMDFERVENLIARRLFSGLFLGGSSSFKTTAPMWCDMAHKHGARFHYGRCSSVKTWERARAMRADSVDSSQMLWSWHALSAFENATAQQVLW